jgi:hypothetical protein
MSAANPLSDSALQQEPEASDDAFEPPLPTQPWHRPPFASDPLSALEPGYEEEEDADFDLHDTIPAPPWLDEPGDGLEAAPFAAR